MLSRSNLYLLAVVNIIELAVKQTKTEYKDLRPRDKAIMDVNDSLPGFAKGGSDAKYASREQDQGVEPIRNEAAMTASSQRNPARSHIAAYLLAVLSLSGCSAKDDTANVSLDAAALQQIVAFDSVPTSAKWEVFGTPEYSGGVPGPTDFVTLVAELTPGDVPGFATRPRAGQVWIAPAAARPWLSGPFHALLHQHQNATVDLSAQPQCRVLGAKLRKTGQPVSGFACRNGATMLIYLTLADNTRS